MLVCNVYSNIMLEAVVFRYSSSCKNKGKVLHFSILKIFEMVTIILHTSTWFSLQPEYSGLIMSSSRQEH